MTNELNLNEAVEVEAVAVESSDTVSKPKRSRMKPKKTGAEIVAELAELKTAVAQLEEAIQAVEEGTIIHQLASKELINKRQQYEDSLNTTYTFS